MSGSYPVVDETAGGGWLQQLAAACRGEGLSSAYQPIVDTARGTIVGYEALMRLGYPERNPEVWLGQARRHGVAADLEAASLRRALEARPHLPSNTFLTVNVSPDLLATPAVRDVWDGERWDLAGVVVELTEQTAIIKLDRGLVQDLDRDEAKFALVEMIGTFADRIDA